MTTTMNDTKQGTLEERTCLDIDDIIRLLKMCLDTTFLTFRNVHYQQTFGTAMGSPVSVTIVNLVMEDQALSTFSPAPRFWNHVDDTCTAISSHLVTPFQEHLNRMNTSRKRRLTSLLRCSLTLPPRWVYMHICI